jgi:hypothetical protein
MDLKQRKLSKSEWESIEIPVPLFEQEVLKLICSGYHNVNIKYNKNLSLLTFLKIEYSEVMEEYLYNKYFVGNITKWNKEYSININNSKKLNINIKKADQIRLTKIDANINTLKYLYEFIIMDLIDNLLKCKSTNNKQWIYSYFTIYKLMQNNILGLNNLFRKFVETLLEKYNDEIDILYIISNATQNIEKNTSLL